MVTARILLSTSLVTVAFVACSSASTPTSEPVPRPATSADPVEPEPSTPSGKPAADIGASCSGGCLGGVTRCLAKSTTCSSAACLLDARGDTPVGYCSASCVQASDCPAGYACEDVSENVIPARMTRACVQAPRGSECESGYCTTPVTGKYPRRLRRVGDAVFLIGGEPDTSRGTGKGWVKRVGSDGSLTPVGGTLPGGISDITGTADAPIASGSRDRVGQIYAYASGAWTARPLGFRDPREIFAGGSQTAFVINNESFPTSLVRVDTDEEAVLGDASTVFGSSASDVYRFALRRQGYHFDGESWSPVVGSDRIECDSGVSRGPEVFCFYGNLGRPALFDGASWASPTIALADGISVSGVAVGDGHVVAAGTQDGKTILLRNHGTETKAVEVKAAAGLAAASVSVLPGARVVFLMSKIQNGMISQSFLMIEQ